MMTPSRIVEVLKSVLRPVEYVGPLRVRATFTARYSVLDQNDEVILDTNDEQWARDCVNWYNSRTQ